MQQQQQQQGKMPSAKLGAVDHFLAGTEAGAILVFIFNPLCLVKTRLALQGSSLNANTEVTGIKKYTGMIDALVTIVKEEGFLGLYKGVVPALFLTSHGAVQFSTYETLKSWSESHRQPKEQQPPWVSVVIGGVSKVVASTITYPYQVIKSRLQQRAILNQGPPKYSGMIDCIFKIWRNEGVFGFFKGVVPNVIKVVPSAAVTFLVYEETMKLLHVKRHQE
jgi:solute carrier family 25 folate transporter 32